MKVLFDQGTPLPLRNHLSHSIDTVAELSWSALENGELLDRTESRGFDVMGTTDQNSLSPFMRKRMAKASWLGPLPPYPQAKPSGEWLRILYLRVGVNLMPLIQTRWHACAGPPAYARADRSVASP